MKQILQRKRLVDLKNEMWEGRGGMRHMTPTCFVKEEANISLII